MKFVTKKINGKALAELLYQKGMSANDLTKQAHLSPSTLNASISNSRPIYQKTAKKIADVLGVEPSEILMDA